MQGLKTVKYLLKSFSQADGPKDHNMMTRLFALLVADRVINPQIYGDNGPNNNNWHLTEVVARNRDLTAVFPAFFGEVLKDPAHFQGVAVQINRYLSDVPAEDLLHIPGQVHEIVLSSHGINKAGGNLRKTQGTYYTPPYIVRHMVDHSLKHLLESGEKPGQNGLLRILDPACGGASFLLEILKSLTARGVSPEKAAASVYGADIDGDAVELSVFVLTAAVLAQHTGIGNPGTIRSLLEKRLMTGNLLTATQSVAANIGESGFDLVIGNPPYVSNKLIPMDEKSWLRNTYFSARGQFDLSNVFLEKGLDLLRSGGILCYITSNKFLAADHGKPLRKELIEKHAILDITDVSTIRAFSGTAAYPVIITVRKQTRKVRENHFVDIRDISDWRDFSFSRPVTISQQFFRNQGEFLITTKIRPGFPIILEKISSASGRILRGSIRCGLAMSGFNKWVIKRNPLETPVGFQTRLVPIIQAGNISPYCISPCDLFDPERLNPAQQDRFRGPKLIVPGIARKLMAAFDSTDSLLGRVYYIRTVDTDYDLKYLAVLLNSHVLDFYYRVLYWPVHLAGDYLRFNSGYLASLPIPSRDNSHYPGLIERIIGIGERLTNTSLSDIERKETILQAQALVFTLYGFDPSESDVVMDYLRIAENEREKIRRFIFEIFPFSAK